jgi:hypothetical protein
MTSKNHSKGANRTPEPTSARKATSPAPGSEPAQRRGTHGLAALTSWAAVAGGAARTRGLAALARGVGLAGALGRRVLRMATGETGRRLARAAALTVVLAVLVGALYDQGDVPTAAARPGVGAAGGSGGHSGSGAAAASSGRGREAARRADPAGQGGLRGRTRPAAVGERPAEVAAAWYAARHGAARGKVKPLQQDRLSAREVRVLILADLGHGRLRTALVRVRRGPDGWRVR